MRDSTRQRGRWRASCVAVRALGLATVTLLIAAMQVEAQPRASFLQGSDVSPGFEGWIPNEDGSYDIVFGYMNRNWEEELHVPVGPENYFSFVSRGELDDMAVHAFDPSAADQGQPTWFQPRRNRFTFRVRVPSELVSDDRELVWTLTTNGSTDRAYASLARDYMIDNVVIMSETGALGAGTSNERTRSNVPPEITLEGPAERTARVGETLTLAARVTDDGVPNRGGSAAPEDATPPQLLARALNPPRRITVGKINGLYFSWSVYRGEGSTVTLDPPQVKTWEDTRAFANSPWGFFWVAPEAPENDRWVSRVTFTEPGVYVLRGRADDGGLFSDVSITVRVSE